MSHPDIAWLISKHFLKSSSKADRTFSTEQSPCFVVMTIEFPLISKWCKRAINTSIIACWTIIVLASPSSKACFTRTPSCRRWDENKSINFCLFFLQLKNFFFLLEQLCSFSHQSELMMCCFFEVFTQEILYFLACNHQIWQWLFLDQEVNYQEKINISHSTVQPFGQGI